VIDFQELTRAVGRTAELLRELGVRQGDRVGLLLPNSFRFVVMHYATLWLGATVVPLHPQLRGELLNAALLQAEPVTVVCSPTEVECMGQKVGQAPSSLVVIDDDSGIPKRVRVLTGSGFNHESCLDLGGFGKVIREPVHAEADAPAVFFMTSGTTGRSKGILLTHRQALFGIDAWVGCWNFDERTVSLMAAPFSHVVYNPLVLGAHRRGGCTAIINTFSSRSVTRVVELARVTAVMGTPSLFIQLLQDHSSLARDLTSIESIIYGAAPTPVPVIRKLSTQFPKRKLYNCYGLTETASALSCLPHDQLPGHEASVGMCHPGVEITIRDDHHRELKPGEQGELYCRGLNVIDSYHGAADLYAARFHDGWLRTGDAGYKDEEGYIYLVGRTDDQINVSGEKVYPADIENVLYRHPGVGDAAVIGITDASRGQIIKAVVVGIEGKQLDLTELRQFCNRHLPPALVPKVFERAQQLPRNASGKVLRRQLS
jgi:long-chain acyl-CoA synthetase